MNSMQAADAEAAAVQKTPHRVTLEDIDESIYHVEYIRPEQSQQMTIAVVTMVNGYIVLGKSAPADPANFDENLGRKFALEDAKRQMWALLGYALRDRLHMAA